jgi:hypothetical protein
MLRRRIGSLPEMNEDALLNRGCRLMVRHQLPNRSRCLISVIL